MKIKLIILTAVIMLFNLFCYKKELSRTVEYSAGTWNESRTEFMMWNMADEMDLYLRDLGKYIVHTLDLKKGELRRSGKPYLKYFGNESHTVC